MIVANDELTSQLHSKGALATDGYEWLVTKWLESDMDDLVLKYDDGATFLFRTKDGSYLEPNIIIKPEIQYKFGFDDILKRHFIKRYN